MRRLLIRYESIAQFHDARRNVRMEIVGHNERHGTPDQSPHPPDDFFIGMRKFLRVHRAMQSEQNAIERHRVFE